MRETLLVVAFQLYVCCARPVVSVPSGRASELRIQELALENLLYSDRWCQKYEWVVVLGVSPSGEGTPPYDHLVDPHSSFLRKTRNCRVVPWSQRKRVDSETELVLLAPLVRSSPDIVTVNFWQQPTLNVAPICYVTFKRVADSWNVFDMRLCSIGVSE